MFPSNNENPFPYHSTETLKKSFPYDHHYPSSRHHGQEPTFHLHFPSPFLDDHDSPLGQIFPQPQLGTSQVAGDQAGQGKTKKGGPSRKRNLGATPPRGRTGKKDRHSKICTAQGVRDRRMRLSLQIARRFFDLQDMLGFDKASKTIEWLFSKSKNAVKELMSTKNINTNASSSVDEYEVGSIMEENSNNEATVIKESRQKARARARERTREKKMMIKGLENSRHFYESNPSSLEQLGSSNNSPFLEESSCQEIRGSASHTHEANYNSQLGIENQFANSVGIMEKYFGGACSGASMLERHQDNAESFMGFLGNWELGGGGAGISPSIDVLAPFAGINPSTLYYGATSFQFRPLDQAKQFSCNHNSLG